MKSLAALFLLTALGYPNSPGHGPEPFPAPVTQATPAPNASASSLTIHNVRPAHAITLGTGARVGILASGFNQDAHPELYAGTVAFPGGTPASDRADGSSEGYWTALSLQEVAPGADIFGLVVEGATESQRLESVEAALEWAAENELDVVTYCAPEFSAAAMARLDTAISKTVAAGVVVVFLDYTHPENLLPGSFRQASDTSATQADLDVYSYDCTALLADTFVALLESDDNDIQRHRPFTAKPSRGALTAGLVALLRSVRPDVSPARVKAILKTTSRPMVVQGLRGQHVPDAFRAVSAVGYPQGE